MNEWIYLLFKIDIDLFLITFLIINSVKILHRYFLLLAIFNDDK